MFKTCRNWWNTFFGSNSQPMFTWSNSSPCTTVSWSNSQPMFTWHAPSRKAHRKTVKNSMSQGTDLVSHQICLSGTNILEIMECVLWVAAANTPERNIDKTIDTKIMRSANRRQRRKDGHKNQTNRQLKHDMWPRWQTYCRHENRAAGLLNR